MKPSQASPPGSRKRGLSPQPGASTTIAPVSKTEAEVEVKDPVTSAPEPSPKKKGRTNTPWTAEEEQRLKTMRDAGHTWSEIAKVRPLLNSGMDYRSP